MAAARRGLGVAIDAVDGRLPGHRASLTAVGPTAKWILGGASPNPSIMDSLTGCDKGNMPRAPGAIAVILRGRWQAIL